MLDRPGTVPAHELIATLGARCPFPPAGTPVACAVSGGADSMALLVLALAAGCEVTAVHVDHGLRRGSVGEAVRVAETAAGLGAAFRSESVVVPSGPNLEARARAARYAVLPAGVLTGHTANDRAETVLINLLRGAGVDGLAGIRATEQRPLLALRRVETELLCAELGIDVFQDPTNTDRRFLRNRVRHEVLPLLCEVAGRDVVPLLCRLADHASGLSDLVRDLAAGVDVTDAGALARLAERAEPVAGEVVRAWLRSGPEAHPPDAATVARVFAVARGAAVGTDVGAGRRVRRSAGRLRLEG